MPYRDGNPLVYDTGDFPAALEGALAAAGYDEFRKEQERLRAAGLYPGIRTSGYVVGTPNGPFAGAPAKPDLPGRVSLPTGPGSSSHGHEPDLTTIPAHS